MSWDSVLEGVREQYVSGRIEVEEFEERVGLALEAAEQPKRRQSAAAFMPGLKSTWSEREDRREYIRRRLSALDEAKAPAPSWYRNYVAACVRTHDVDQKLVEIQEQYRRVLESDAMKLGDARSRRREADLFRLQMVVTVALFMLGVFAVGCSLLLV